MDDQVVGAGVDRQAAVGRARRVVEGDDHARAGERHQPGRHGSGVAGALGRGDRAVAGGGLGGEPLHLLLEVGELRGLPGDRGLALAR